MSDILVRAITRDGMVHAAAVFTRDTVERARQIHKTLPVATAALGRALSGVSMMGNALKGQGASITLSIKGDGPLGNLLVVSDAEGNVRGYVQHPQISLMEKYKGKLDVGGAVGTNGMLTVIRDLQMKEPYIGSVELVSGEIAEDIASYFVQSEQCPTACALGVLVDADQHVRAAGGYIIQLLPGAPDETIDRIEAGIEKAGAVTNLLDKGMTAQELLETVLADLDLEILETSPVSYKCYCDRERVTATLISLGKKELTQIVEDRETIHIECQFCDTIYDFTPEEIAKILEEI